MGLKWDYQVVDLSDNTDRQSTIDELDGWRLLGWELVIVTAAPGARVTAWFKRARSEDWIERMVA